MYVDVAPIAPGIENHRYVQAHEGIPALVALFYVRIIVLCINS